MAQMICITAPGHADCPARSPCGRSGRRGVEATHEVCIVVFDHNRIPGQVRSAGVNPVEASSSSTATLSRARPGKSRYAGKSPKALTHLGGMDQMGRGDGSRILGSDGRGGDNDGCEAQDQSEKASWTSQTPRSCPLFPKGSERFAALPSESPPETRRPPCTGSRRGGKAACR